MTVVEGSPAASRGVRPQPSEALPSRPRQGQQLALGAGERRVRPGAILAETAPHGDIFNQNFQARIQVEQAKQVLPQLYLIAVPNPLPQPVARGAREQGGARGWLLLQPRYPHMTLLPQDIASVFPSSKKK